MGKTAFIFPGQGAQKAGMGKDFFMRNTIQQRMFSTLPVSGWIWI